MDIDVTWLETASLAAAVVMAAVLFLLFAQREQLYRHFLKHCNGAESERRVAFCLLSPLILFLVFGSIWIWFWLLREPAEIQIALPAADVTSVAGAQTTSGQDRRVEPGIGKKGTTGVKNTTGKKNTSRKGGSTVKNSGRGGFATKPAKPPPPVRPPATAATQPKTGDASCINQGIISTSQDCLDLVALVEKLSTAPIAYNRPENMYRGEPEQISLVIDPLGATNLKAQMRALTGPVVETETQITRNMSAEITGSLFEIAPSGVQTKTLSPLVPTRWDWRITPQKEGDAPLTLNIYVIFDQGDGRRESIAIRNYTDPVQVHVHAIDKVGDVVARAEPVYAFLATVVTGLFGFCVWLITRWRKLKGGADAT